MTDHPLAQAHASGQGRNSKRHSMWAIVRLIALAVSGCGPALAVDADADADGPLRAEIEALRQRITALELADDDRALARAELVQDLVREILHDADRRSSLLDHRVRAGHDGRFFIADDDGRFRLNVGGQMQTRYIYNRQSGGPEDDHRAGFELRRIQLRFDGHALDPRLRYKVQGGFNRAHGAFELLDAEIGWAISDDWFVRGGQFRPGFLREDSTSSTRQLAVERSLVNGRFAQNRMQGIELRGLIADRWRVSGMVSDGLRSRNTPWVERTVEYALTGRAEWLALGSWNQFRQFTSPIGEEPGLMFGSAIHWQRDEFGTPHDHEMEMLRWTVDGQLSFGGASVFAAFIASHEDAHGAGSQRRWGMLVQAAAYLSESWEVFARYETGDLDEGGDDRLSAITAGVNRYLAGHALKWTTDVGVGLKPVHPQWASGGAGWRADSPGRSGQVVVRTQLQLLF